MRKLLRKSLLTGAFSLAVVGMAVPAYAASYQVQENDSLWSIAAKHQISLEAMINANLNVDADQLVAGQMLALPVSTKNTYAVQKGDTFWKLADQWNLPLDQLLSANPDKDPLNLYPGLVLQLPNGFTLNSAEEQAGREKKNDAFTRAALPAAAEEAALPPAPASLQPTPAQAEQNVVTTASGQAFTYSKVIEAKATAYSDAPEENGWGPIDYFGNPLELGTIAVDPNVIPMNSTLYVTGYDSNGLPVGGMIGRATDQGSAIKGNKIDIFMPGTPDEVRKFGIQDVTVYILE
ncbi:LysM peptidoglycan-binding domain-containing protein [Paenibacillus senegalensis]|uniref:LysM peptidoglycan-binding domain-containing protein n=1 Tax=Paenibacillus senegalensis TaxID=1465766 RepID=UPI000288C81D|nr:LysM peptidoglycan-binding domain-containing protein [Paenibacillus senegalensis]